MSKLGQIKDPLLYPTEGLVDEEDWEYMYSYSFQAPKKQEKKEEKDRNSSEGRFEGLLDMNRENYSAAQRKRLECWQREAKEFCTRLGELAEDFDTRRASTFFEIILSTSMDRDPALLLGKTGEMNSVMEEIAYSPWMFPMLPGTNLTGNWVEKLPELYKRIINLKPLTLWHEPFDESFAFQQSLYQLLERLAGQALKFPDKLLSVREPAKHAFLVLIAITLNSGSYDRIVLLPLNSIA
jgi:hypothetical protein